jgi:hypothetical protein
MKTSHSYYPCDNLYDGDTDTYWRTKNYPDKQNFPSNPDWVELNFDKDLLISKVELLQFPAHHGQFKEMELEFANNSKTELLSLERNGDWYSVDVIPPITSNHVKLTATEYYLYEGELWESYGPAEIRIYGSSIGKYFLGASIMNVFHYSDNFP